MTTEPTDLREKIAARIQPFLAVNYPCKCAPDDPTCDREWSEAEELADAVLPIVREAQKQAWDECAQEQGTWPRPKGDPRALTFILLANNPYRDEESIDDE